MTDQHWQRTWEVFERASELLPAEREAFVRDQLPDPILAERVFEMLRRLSGSEDKTVANLAPEPEPEWARLGQTIGRFRITGTLGRGGMGEVYEALDTELERKVAIKFLASGRFGSTGGMERFQREARAASALNHPGVVTIHEILRLGADMAIVMERVEGEPLRKRCGTPLPRKETARLGAQVAQALAVAHAAGIVHRDIKPENLMLRPDGLIKILDFGLARHITADSVHSTQGLPLGTLRYMSPEQIRGEKATSASDVFALGLVLYELATGRHPFHAGSPLATTHRISSDEPAPPSQVIPGLDREFETLVLRMLEKDPARRPAAAAVAAELTRESAPPHRANVWKWVAIPAALAAIAIAVLLANRGRPLSTPAAAPLPARSSSFSNLPGDEIDAEFAPGGQSIAYAWNGGDDKLEHDIYIKPVGVENPLRLTSDPADEFSPVWSPDGTRIAFLRAAGAGVQVVVIHSDGSKERVIATGSTQSAVKKRLAWGAGGNEVLFGDDSPGHPDALTLYRIALDTGERRRFSNESAGEEDLSPTLAPDQRHLAFVRAEGTHRNVWVARSDGTGLRRLVESKVNIHNIAWNPDSQGIYYVQEDEERLIRQRRLDGGEPRPINVGGPIRHLAVSRNGRHMAYVQALSEGNIWRYNPTARAFHKVLNLTSNEEDPMYSPSGKWIAFTSDRSARGSIFVMNAGGGDMRQLTFLKGYTASASWSPDEQWIAFDGAPEGHSAVYVASFAGGAPRKLARGYMPLFSATGNWVYFTSKATGRNEVWRVALEGGDPVQVTTNGGLEARESPDGKWLYYSKPTVKGIFRRAMQGGAEILLPSLQPFERYWDVAADGIYYAADGKLLRYDIASGQSQELAKFGRPPVRGPRGISVGNDGSVLYIQFDSFRREIRLADISGNDAPR